MKVLFVLLGMFIGSYATAQVSLDCRNTPNGDAAAALGFTHVGGRLCQKDPSPSWADCCEAHCKRIYIQLDDSKGDYEENVCLAKVCKDACMNFRSK
jgi:hypothetical protein